MQNLPIRNYERHTSSFVAAQTNSLKQKAPDWWKIPRPSDLLLKTGLLGFVFVCLSA